MKGGAALANALWLARNAPAAATFARALGDVRATQARWLQRQLARHAASGVGQAHDFATMRSVADFTRRVPLSDYTDAAPAIARIRRGERDVLACGAVTHLAPTSGSSGARKLIPFTADLQAGFGAAVGAWIVDLARQRPALVGGPAYWSVSPLADPDIAHHDATHDAPAPGQPAPDNDTGLVPVGFADDAEYLGGASAWLVRQALAVPADVAHVRDVSAFWALTLLALLRERDLRLISIWHPSFLELLVGAAEPHWPLLMDAIAGGTSPWSEALPPAARGAWQRPPAPARASELRRIGGGDWERWWPRLQVVSCWGEQAAEGGWQRLRRKLPHVLVQPKGLLATEAVVTIPYAHTAALAVTSHLFEFVDGRGDVRLAHQLERGQSYEVIVTNGGGLWRYRLGDVVECTGHLRDTPTLRFSGRTGVVSDLRGEKLSEPFVAEALRTLWPAERTPAYSALQALDDADGARYELLVSGDVTALTPAGRDAGASPPRPTLDAIAERLEQALAANPHYALARRLGQLAPLRVTVVSGDRGEAAVREARGRMGDAKPRVLLRPGDGTR
jgi:hypothetical protein